MDFGNFITKAGGKIEVIFESDAGKRKLEQFTQASLQRKFDNFILYEELDATSKVRIYVDDNGMFSTEAGFQTKNEALKGKILVVILKRAKDNSMQKKPCNSAREFLKDFPLISAQELCKFCPLDKCSDRQTEFDKEYYEKVIKTWLD